MNDDSQVQLVNNGYGFGSDSALGSGLRPGNKPTDPYGDANVCASDRHAKASYADTCAANTDA